MKILKLLNKKCLSIIIVVSLMGYSAEAEDKPIDIWNLEKKKIEETPLKKNTDIAEQDDEIVKQNNLFNNQSKKKFNDIKVDTSFNSEQVKIIGLYDPEDYDLKIDMWTNSNGDQLKDQFSNLSKLNLSEDASDLMNIVMLTNSYYPNIDISDDEFLKLKSEWLIKNQDRDLIEEYLVKNQIIDLHPKLSRYLIDQHMSESNVKKACKIFSKNTDVINDEYLSKFNLYCLVNEGKKEEAQLIFDLKKELGFKDEYFEKKINHLFGFIDKKDQTISEKNILDFHLAHRTNSNFTFEPKENTDKLIWKYLATSNLLFNFDEIDITELDKISLIEKATNDKNYSEDNLFSLYKKFQFNINQLLNALDFYKTLPNVEARALIYQKILLESDINKKLELIKILKNLFVKDDISNAFDDKLKSFLKSIDPQDIPSNLSTFYINHYEIEDKKTTNIKFNKDILHQSKLVNYFNGNFSKSKIEKDINNFLKKIKKNKKYFISKKDIILIESLKSDGIKIAKKYNGLYEINDAEIPTDIQVMINNNEVGLTLLRIIEVIGQDELKSLDEDTLYFIIWALNKLNIDYIRNKILLEVLPLKV